VASNRTFDLRAAAIQTVDNLLCEEDAQVKGFMKSFAKEHPLGPHPSEEEVGEDRILRGVKVLGKYYLFIWDTYQRSGSHDYLGYRFVAPNGVILFQGTDFGVPQGTAIDSDQIVLELLGWFILRPGDTDDEYFEKYTPQQLEFAEGQDAAELALGVSEAEQGGEKPFTDLPGYEHGEDEE
jgi:hypothetical protein